MFDSCPGRRRYRGRGSLVALADQSLPQSSTVTHPAVDAIALHQFSPWAAVITLDVVAKHVDATVHEVVDLVHLLASQRVLQTRLMTLTPAR
eukprot:5393717-Heterocapsa_arctica.AAC.1